MGEESTALQLNFDPTGVKVSMIADCCKRYLLSATEFSFLRGCRFSLPREESPREGFLLR